MVVGDPPVKILHPNTPAVIGSGAPVLIAPASTALPIQMLVDWNMEYTGTPILVDGDMEAATPDSYLAGNGASLSKVAGNPSGSGSQVLKVAYVSTPSPFAYQPNVLTVGKTYHITGWARGDDTYAPRVYDLGGGLSWIGAVSTSWQQFDIVGVAAHVHLACLSYASAAGGWAEFDEIYVTEDAPAWTVGNSALLSKKPDGDSLVLRIAYIDTADPYASQTVMTIGEDYRVVGSARSDGSGIPKIYDGTTLLWTGTTSTSWQDISVDFTATDTEFRLYNITSSAAYTEFDNVAVYKMP